MWNPYSSVLASIFFFSSVCQAGMISLREGRLAPRASGALCAVMDQRTAVVGDKLYFMGGTYTFNDNNADTLAQEPYLYWLPLNTTSIPVNGFLPNSTIWFSPVPSGVSLEGAGSFFHDNQNLYLFAGLGTDNSVTSNMWKFNTTSQEWTNVFVDGGKFQHDNRYGGLFASVPWLGQAYFLGGADTDITGMVKFDSSGTALKWVNQTDSSVPRLYAGEMVYARFGKKGVLVAFGGYNTSQQGTEFANGWPWDHALMDHIEVYDIDSGTWYTVQASGDIPPHRSEFCATVSSAPDDSSHQITIHAGWDLLLGASYEDIYVLSLPSFQWIKISPLVGENDPDGKVAGIGRSHHHCVNWGDGQMIVLGGELNLGKTQVNNGGCNSSYLPIKVLDTSTYAWKDEFNPTSNYTVPGLVSDVVGGGPTGGATLKSPASGWNNTELASIFSQTVARARTEATPASAAAATGSPATVSLAAPLSGSSGSPMGKKPVNPALTGGIAGGLAGLAVVLALALLFLKRLKRKRALAAKAEGRGELAAEERKAELSGDPLRYELPGGEVAGELPARVSKVATARWT